MSEFLPISSSGHLVLVPALLGWEPPPLVFDTTLHLGTLLAVIVVFWRDLVHMFVSWWRGIFRARFLEDTDSRLAWWVILGTVPGVIAGLFFVDFFEYLFGSPSAVGVFLLLTAVLLVLAELLGRRSKELFKMTWLDSLLVGIGQAASIAPGLSRSGTTITVGVFCGMTREAAVRFSFLLAVPIIAGAGLGQLARLLTQGSTDLDTASLVIGFITAAIFGYAAIRFLLAYLRTRSLYPFAVYCVAVGILTLVLL